MVRYDAMPTGSHPIASFQFADSPPLCFSIEIRKKLGQTYSTIGGVYRRFELIYIVADERDVIRLRTNYRNEDIYLYRTTVSPTQARERFLEYIHSLNALHNKPRWNAPLGPNPVVISGSIDVSDNKGTTRVQLVHLVVRRSAAGTTKKNAVQEFENRVIKQLQGSAFEGGIP